MNAAEYVRSRWEDCGSAGPVQFAECWQVWCGAHFFCCGETEQQAWEAALAFTKEREEQIRQVEEEIAFLDHIVSFEANASGYLAFTRILAREQEALADLKRGMK